MSPVLILITYGFLTGNNGAAADEEVGWHCIHHAESVQTWERIENGVEEREDSSGRVCVPPFLSMLIFLAGS